jgi:hypothetical protein
LPILSFCFHRSDRSWSPLCNFIFVLLFMSLRMK